jgi:lysophospholipase L1-like esterase
MSWGLASLRDSILRGREKKIILTVWQIGEIINRRKATLSKPTPSGLREMEIKMRILKKTSAVGFVLLILSISCITHTASAADCWIGTWLCGQQLVESGNNPPSPYLANNTLRQVVHATLGGSRIRVQFSNKYSSGPLTINAAHIAASAGGSAINTATDTALTFGGASSVTINAGQEVYSDTLDFNVAPLSSLAVSIYFGAVSSTNVTGHPGSRTTSYIKTGNTVSAASMTSPVTTTDHWYILSGIDLWLNNSYACVVTLGDSITDGRGSTTNGNNRWPDDLANRLHADPSTAKVGVLNQGIGGNAVVSGGLGPTAMARFDHDVLEQSGVRWVIILEGVNDIGGNQSAANLIAAYQQFIDKAHAHNILAYGVPILPFKGSQYDTAAHQAVRDTVNDWIRTSGKFDAVIDLDAAVRDPANPNKLLAAYDSGDHLHLSVAGYQKMADSIDVNLFEQKKVADLNNDGNVDFIDFAVLGGQWRQAPALPSADIAPVGGDGAVDFNDISLMTQEWLIV